MQFQGATGMLSRLKALCSSSEDFPGAHDVATKRKLLAASGFNSEGDTKYFVPVVSIAL